jgi:hypothetical protein
LISVPNTSKEISWGARRAAGITGYCEAGYGCLVSSTQEATRADDDTWR